MPTDLIRKPTEQRIEVEEESGYTAPRRPSTSATIVALVEGRDSSFKQKYL